MIYMSSFSSEARGSVLRGVIWHIYLILLPPVHSSPLSYLIVIDYRDGTSLIYL